MISAGKKMNMTLHQMQSKWTQEVLNRSLTFGVSLFLTIFFLPQIGQSQSAHSNLRTGDQHYQEKQYMLAEEAYRKSIEKKPSLKGAYNLGNTLYQQNRYEEAIQQYDEAIAKAGNPEELARAYYNKGTALMGAQNYGESIESLKNALVNDPNNLEAKQNLFIAKRLLQQQMQQQQQQQQEQNQEQQEQEQQEQQEQQQQEQEQEQQQQQDQNQQQQEQQQEEREQEEKQDLDKKDAERLLEIVENEEKKVQEKMRRTSGEKTKSKKDW